MRTKLALLLYLVCLPYIVDESYEYELDVYEYEWEPQVLNIKVYGPEGVDTNQEDTEWPSTVLKTNQDQLLETLNLLYQNQMAQ